MASNDYVMGIKDARRNGAIRCAPLALFGTLACDDDDVVTLRLSRLVFAAQSFTLRVASPCHILRWTDVKQ